ncbi:hypothetical protein [Streptomyces ipomoeae]|uniref:hypothetical protein n=1 Tax=Streptomyces ipomoeae TaxID=103232 RepID=UPI0029BB9D00|nr:hypothetical protein [Streptomyces ipomoeae]MDX2695753.1 hypothetical protein [Streptomyces ipomoeae]MDX2840463.1 hypothetical protein [Streptomyces ipomoeae]
MHKTLGLTLATVATVGSLAVTAPAYAQPATPATALAAPVAPAAAPAAPAADVSAAGSRLLYKYNFMIVKYATKPGAEAKAFKALKNCFGGCTFPVKGAPKKLPTREGTFINLKACAAGPFGCRKAPVKFYRAGVKYGWHFIAQKGHFDGAGSRIYFTIYRKNGYLYLGVRAFVTKPTVPDALNKKFANKTWATFASNIGLKMGANG